MTLRNKSAKNDRGKCLAWPVTSYSPAVLLFWWREIQITASVLQLGFVMWESQPSLKRIFSVEVRDWKIWSGSRLAKRNNSFYLVSWL